MPAKLERIVPTYNALEAELDPQLRKLYAVAGKLIRSGQEDLAAVVSDCAQEIKLAVRKKRKAE